MNESQADKNSYFTSFKVDYGNFSPNLNKFLPPARLNEDRMRSIEAQIRHNWNIVLNRRMPNEILPKLLSLSKEKITSLLEKLPEDKQVIHFKVQGIFSEPIIRALRIIRHHDSLTAKGFPARVPFPGLDYTLTHDLREDLRWLGLRLDIDPKLNIAFIYEQSLSALKDYYR